MKKLILCLLLLCLLSGVWITVHAEPVTLSFNRDSITISVGRYVTVYAEISPVGALGNDVIFSTSDESIASVNRDGKLRALHVGDCELTATSKYDKSISTTIPVHVIVPVRDIEIIAEDKGVVLGETVQLTTEIIPTDATMQSIVWSSRNDSIATVSQDGLVTGISRGDVYIKAVTADERASDTIRITVKQPPESVTVSPEAVTLAEGKNQKLSATVLPRDTNDKTVLWSSADESVATVSNRGVITGVELGQTVITGTCKDNPNATVSVPVTVLKLASSVAFDQSSYEIILGDSLQLNHTVYPAETSNQAVTYRVGNKYVASIDENGVVTALKGGTTTVTVTTADGSRKKGTATIKVLVPVTGVSYSRSDIRVGERHYGHFTVNLEPSNATNKNMTWTSADPSIATVSGDTNRFRVDGGYNWGRTTITGTTEDGGYSITLHVNVGSLYRAVTVKSLSIRNGRPYITLQNNSGMVITQVRYFMQGLDSNQQIIEMSTTGDLLTLYGAYDVPLYPGETTQHGRFTFYSPSNYQDLSYLFIVVTGWSTSTGYYNSHGDLVYTYHIPEDYQELIIFPSYADPALYRTNG